MWDVIGKGCARVAYRATPGCSGAATEAAYMPCIYREQAKVNATSKSNTEREMGELLARIKVLGTRRVPPWPWGFG